MSFGQPAGLYSVEVNGNNMMDIGEIHGDNPLTEVQLDKLEWAKQREERRMINRIDKTIFVKRLFTNVATVVIIARLTPLPVCRKRWK